MSTDVREATGGRVAPAEPSASSAFDAEAAPGGDEIEVPSAPLRAQAGALWALLVVAVCTGVGWLVRPWFSVTEQAMVYLVGVLVTSARAQRRYAVAGALLAVAALDFFFVPPVLAFLPTHSRDVVTVVAFLATSLVVSGYATRVRQEVERSRERERRAAALYVLSRALAGQGRVADVASSAVDQVQGLLGRPAAIYRLGSDGSLSWHVSPGGDEGRWEEEAETARWVCEHAVPAGLGTDRQAWSGALHLPLLGRSGGRAGMVVAAPKGTPVRPLERRLLETLAAVTAVAMDRALLAEDAERARQAVETERLRNALLAGVSHDLRTPLASMTGAAGALLSTESDLTEAGRRRLLASIRDEGERMGRLVADLLDLTRIETGGFRPKREWYPAEDLVTSAVERAAVALGDRPVHFDVPPDVLLLWVDGVLIQQVLVNLLENAAKHTPAGSPIELAVEVDAQAMRLEVRDRGDGLPPGELDGLFGGFRRATGARPSQGTGLGLALCQAIARVHGGSVTAGRREGGGAVLRVTLPRDGEPVPPVPSVPAESNGAPGET